MVWSIQCDVVSLPAVSHRGGERGRAFGPMNPDLLRSPRSRCRSQQPPPATHRTHLPTLPTAQPAPAPRNTTRRTMAIAAHANKIPNLAIILRAVEELSPPRTWGTRHPAVLWLLLSGQSISSAMEMSPFQGAFRQAFIFCFPWSYFMNCTGAHWEKKKKKSSFNELILLLG